MKERILRIDQKGRVHIPKELRQRLGIKTKVRGRMKDGALVMEPIPNLLDRLGRQVRFNFKSIEKALPSLRKVAEEELLREIP